MAILSNIGKSLGGTVQQAGAAVQPRTTPSRPGSTWGIPTSVPAIQAQARGSMPGVYNPNGDNAFMDSFRQAADSGYFSSPDPQETYLAQFDSGLGEARAAIQAQMQAALSEIGQREGIANQAIGQMPADLNAIYAPAQAQVANTSQALATAQQNSGLTPLLPAGAEAAPIQAALASALSSRQADVPYLQQAASASFGKQRADIQAGGGGQLADIAVQEAQMRRSDAKDARDYAAAQASDKAARQQTIEDKTAAYEHDREMARLNARLSGQKQTKKDQVTWGRFEVDPQRGGAIAQDRPDLAQHIRNGKDKPSKVYRHLVDQLTKNPPKDAEDLLKRINGIKKRHHSLPRAVSLALFDAGITGQ